MSTTVTYKGSTLTTVSNNTKVLKTAGKYMEDDVVLIDAKTYTATIVNNDEGASNVRYNGSSYTGGSFEFRSGETIRITAGASHSSGEVYVNNERVATSGQDEFATYNYTTSATDIEITFSYVSGSGHRVSIIEAQEGSSTIQSLTVTPSESVQTFNASSVDGYKPVTVNAISSTYVGSGITRRSSTDLTASGATITAPAGYYSAAASKSVASGSASAPSSISGTSASVSTGTNTLTLTKAVSVTPVVSAGYISSGTATNSSVSLTASIPVNPTVTASGATITIPTGYYTTQTTKSVASGSATGPSNLSASSATVTTGNNTITLTKTNVTTTPTVNAGYVSSATASTATVALTASVITQAAKTVTPTESEQTAVAANVYTTGIVKVGAIDSTYVGSGVTRKAAATITPSTTNQTIASGTYLTGTQTILGDANLIGSNIVQGASIFNINGTATFQSYYTGSSAPASSLGNNGDIYLQE